MEKTFAMISLGCAKNLVNSEQMLYLMSEAGYTLVPDPEGADLAIVNTCGFIDAAKSEAIDNILEMAQLKKAGKLGGLIAVLPRDIRTASCPKCRKLTPCSASAASAKSSVRQTP